MPKENQRYIDEMIDSVMRGIVGVERFVLLATIGMASFMFKLIAIAALAEFLILITRG